jgi:DNA-binding SARP family transcriptional activator
MRVGLRVIRRMLALAAAAGCGLVLVLLKEDRPAFPSLSSTITLELVRDTVALAAWGACVALVALLLVRSLQAVVARAQASQPRVPVARPRLSLGHARLPNRATEGGFPPPFPLVLRAPATTPDHPPVCDRSAAAPAESEPARPSISLLGPMRIEPLSPRPRSRRSHAEPLLAYLALHRDGATTDELAANLWSGLDDEKARKRLWGSISDARSHLGEVILRADERYRLDRDAVAIDLDRFESLLTQADRNPAARRQLLERALQLVRGDPLAGSDYPWALGEIRCLRATIIDRLAQLGQLRLDDSDPAGALAAAEQAIALDPHNEPAHRLAMRAEGTLGLRQAIAERYSRLARELDTRFGLEPERETRLLYRTLLSQDAVAVHSS